MKINKIFIICVFILALLSISIVSANDNTTIENMNETDSMPNIYVPAKIWKDDDYNITIESVEPATVDITGSINYNSPITTGKTSIPITNLSTGYHNIYINYLSNSTNFQKEYNITVLKENPNWDLDFEWYSDEITLDHFGDHEWAPLEWKILNKPEGITGNFSLYENGKLLDTFNAQNIDDFMYGNIFKFQEYNYTLSYSGDDYFKPVNKTKHVSVRLVIIKIPSEVVLGYDDNIITDRYYATQGTLTIKINGTTFKIDEYNQENYNYSYSYYSLNHLELNKTYDIEVTFTSKEHNYTKKATVNVSNRIKNYVTFNEADKYFYGKTNVFTFKAPEINLNISIDGEKVNSTYKNNKHEINITNLVPGDHTITVSYDGDEKYAKNSFITNFEIISRAEYSKNIKLNDNNYLTLQLPKDAFGNLTLIIKKDEKYEYKTVKITNNIVNIPLPTNHLGTYEFRGYFNGNYELNEIYGLYSVYTTFGKWIATGNVDLNNTYYLSLILPNDANGNVTVEIKKDNGDYEFYKTVELEHDENHVEHNSPEYNNMTAIIMLPTNHIGIYYYKANFNGNYEINQYENKYKVNSYYKIITPINIDSPNIYYKSNAEIKLTLPKDGIGTLTLELRDKNDTYIHYKSVELVNGSASIEFPTNHIGIQYFNAFYNGNYEVDNLTDYSIAVLPKIKYENNMFSMIGDKETKGTFNIVTFKKTYIDTHFNYDSGPEYEFNVTNGHAEMDITELLKKIDDEIMVEAQFKGFDGTFTNTDRYTFEPIFEFDIFANDITMYYNDGTTFKAKIYRNNNTINPEENITLKIGSNTYNLKTNENGEITKKITLTPGTYTITTTYKNNTLKNKITVNHIVILKKVTVKKSAKKLVLQTTLKKGKTTLKNKVVTFKFNGKKYTAKTNKKGVAKVTIKSNILKKLKVGKKVTYQATYLKDTVKQTIKVKK